MATDAYYLHLAKQQQEQLKADKLTYDEDIPTRGVRHHRMSKQAKVRHTHILREKACEEPRRETVDGERDPLAGQDKEAIMSRRQAESINARRTVNGGLFTSRVTSISQVPVWDRSRPT